MESRSSGVCHRHGHGLLLCMASAASSIFVRYAISTNAVVGMSLNVSFFLAIRSLVKNAKNKTKSQLCLYPRVHHILMNNVFTWKKNVRVHDRAAYWWTTFLPEKKLEYTTGLHTDAQRFYLSSILQTEDRRQANRPGTVTWQSPLYTPSTSVQLAADILPSYHTISTSVHALRDHLIWRKKHEFLLNFSQFFFNHGCKSTSRV